MLNLELLSLSLPGNWCSCLVHIGTTYEKSI